MTERGVIDEKGPPVGYYLDRDIPAWIVARGGKYAFDCLWDEERGDLAQLDDGELVIAPGLIYKIAEKP
jgi:hypothetical protein